MTKARLGRARGLRLAASAKGVEDEVERSGPSKERLDESRQMWVRCYKKFQVE